MWSIHLNKASVMLAISALYGGSCTIGLRNTEDQILEDIILKHHEKMLHFDSYKVSLCKIMMLWVGVASTVVRSLPSNHKVPSSIPGSAEI